MPSSTHLPLSPSNDDPPELEYSSPSPIMHQHHHHQNQHQHQHPPPSQHRLSDTDEDDAEDDLDSMHDGEQPLSRARPRHPQHHPTDVRRSSGGVPERYQHRIDSSSSAAVQPASSSLPVADDHIYSHDGDVEMDEKTEEKKVDHSRRATLRPLRPFYLNQWLDVKDTQDSWLEAQVIQLDSAPVLRANDDSAVTTTTIASASSSSSSSSGAPIRQIRIHYKGFRNIYDEWLDVSHDQTKDMLERITPLHGRTEVPNPIVWPRPFSSVGDKVDCKDKLGTWLPASIANIDDQHLQVEIKYDNWNEKHNEWLNADSYRIQPIGAFTQAPITAVKPRGVGGGRVVGPTRGQAAAGVSTHSAAVSAEKIAQFQASQTNEMRFRNILGEKLGYEIVDQKEDGNCLFRSVSHQVYGDPSHHRLVRLFTLKYIESEKYFFQNYIAGETFEQYILRMRNDGEWGDNLEIQAISEIYDRPIEIYAYSHKPLKTFTSSSSSSHSAKPIRLSYHFASHYNSVINRATHQQSCLTTAPGVVEEEALQRVARLRREFDLQRQALTAAAANAASSSNASPEIPSALVSSRATFSNSQSRLQANPFDFENAVASSLSEMDATYEATLAQAQQESAREHEEAQLLAAVAKQSEVEAIEQQHLAAAAASAAACASSSSAVPSLSGAGKSTIEEDNLNRALAASLADVPSALNEDDELAAVLRESAAAMHHSPSAAISMSSDDDLQRALQSSLAERENQLPSAVRSCVNLGFSLDQAITAWTVVGDPATASGASEEIVVQRMMDFMLSN